MDRIARDRPLIAIINDDRLFLELMETLLEELEDYEVVVRREWDQAYPFVKETQPDLVILDIVIGREERGWTILELLTLDPQTRPIPVIVCTAALRSLQDHEPLLRSYGVYSLPKPFDLEALLALVQTALHRDPPAAPGGDS
jgi:CheY-like chemotaxis protein